MKLTIEGKGALLRWLENRYLRRYFHGRGMEIGALWRRFSVPAQAKVWYLDRSDRDRLEQHYPELKNRILQPDLLAEATQLPVRPANLDFLIASHVLEHLPFPLAALRSWYEALARGGILLLKVPDKRFTFDVHRSRTPLAHLLDEYQNPQQFDARAHYADWVEKVGGQKPSDPHFAQSVRHLMDQSYSIHFHVWIDDDISEIIDFTRQKWKLEWEPAVFWRAHFYRKETTVLLLRK